jgi:threonine aldolase
MTHSFGSDNHSGIHPAVIAAIAGANHGHDIAYGDDAVTLQLQQRFKALFGTQAEIFPVFNGTGANVFALKVMTKPFHAIVCAETAHIHVDECGAPEHHTGCKLLTVPSPDGKLTPGGVKAHFHNFGFQHHAQPKVIAISQPTELGKVYTPGEIRALAELAHAHDMYLYVDGSRLIHAAAALDLPFRAFTVDCGVDALSFGGTKCGLMMGEVVVLFRPEWAAEAAYARKQAMQLYSKMRFVSAQFEALFAHDLWKIIALHGNRMAALLATELSKLPNVKITQQVQTNAVFAALPGTVIAALQKQYFFYVWKEETREIRLMTSFDTTKADVYGFVESAGALLTAS